MKTRIKIILFSLLIIISYNHLVSKIIWNKYFNPDSMSYYLMAKPNSIIHNGNNVILMFYGTYTGIKQVRGTGFFITDLFGNELKRYNIIKDTNIRIDFIVPKNEYLNIFTSYGNNGIMDLDPCLLAPYKIVLDKEFNIIEENYDTSNRKYYNGNWVFRCMKDDSIIINIGTYDYKTRYHYDNIFVLDFSTKFIREIIIDTIQRIDIWKKTGTMDFFVTQKDDFLFIIWESNNTNYTEQSSIVLMNKEGKQIWRKAIKYKNKPTKIIKVIENSDGDFIGVGTTSPDPNTQDINAIDTGEIQNDSLLIFKITKYGYLEWLKEYPLKNYSDITNSIVIYKDNSFIVYGHFLNKPKYPLYQSLSFYYIFNSNGDIVYQEYMLLDTSKDLGYYSLLCLNDTLLFYGGIGSIAYGIEKLCLTAVIPDYTSIPNELKNENSNFTSYPNPASEFIEIKANVEIDHKPISTDEIKIYNTLGECVMTVGNRHICSLRKINVSHLPSGVYYIKAGRKSKMFIKM